MRKPSNFATTRAARSTSRTFGQPLVTDPLQNRPDGGISDPAHYWDGLIPQVVVIDGDGRVVFDRHGHVNVDAINAAVSDATGIPMAPGSGNSATLSFNELNSEVVASR